MTADHAPDRQAAADAVDRFISATSSWIGWWTLIRFEEGRLVEPRATDFSPAVGALLEPFVVGSPPEIDAANRDFDRQQAGQRVFELTGKQNDEKVKVRDAGRALAADLEAIGIDSTPVLTIVHCTEMHGGGPAYVAPRWEEWRVLLQRIAIRLRVRAEASASAPAPPAIQTCDPPPPALPEAAATSSPTTVSRRSPRRDPDFRTRVAADRARGDSWETIADRYGVSRQAAEKWRKWEEVRAAEAVRAKRTRGGIRRPERLGDRDRDVADEHADD